MALVTLRDIEVSYGSPPLMESVNLSIEQGERVCLVGRNGCGKTSLIKMILGETGPDKGEIHRGDGVRIAGLAQQVPSRLPGTCFDVVSEGLDVGFGSVDEHQNRIETVISRLGLDGGELVDNMSGGQKRRALLARALSGDPDLLLLDEPTNHLDIDSIDWLEQFLLRYRGTLLFVTHDRVFLQKLATRIIELDRGKLTSWPGDYASYLKKKQAALENEERDIQKFDKKLAAEEVWIRKGVRERRTRNEGRVRALKKMREMARARRSRAGSANIRVSEAGRTSKRVVKLQNVDFGYGDRPPLIKDMEATVYRGDKVGIIGPNGCGKTTLIRLMLGDLEPLAGDVTRGDNLQVAYLDQLRGQLDDQKTVIENVIDSGDMVVVGGRSTHIITYLKDFLFSSERARTPVWVLSGGERNRLLLAKLFTRPSNVLVLDEPTNDLDTETLELLEARLVEYSGTVLLVSHDRAFLNNAVTSTLVFEGGGKIGEYVGGYDDWLIQRAPREEKKPKEKTKEKTRRPKPDSPRKLTFKEKFELEALPAKIESLEDEQQALHARMADPEFYKKHGEEISEATDRIETLEAELATLYERWTDLESIRESGER